MKFQWCLVCLCCVASFTYVRSRQQPVYMNQFAVHVPSGSEAADVVAEKHGFKNLGQIGSLKNYFLFEHQHVHKRSLTSSDHHHSLLQQEKQVAWVQQQHEKRRRKRDYTEARFGGGFADLPSFLGARSQPQAQAHAPTQHRQHYRGIGVQNLFPDPLYKEQWYLNGGAKDGFDMNVAPAWQKGYTGKGVVVSILDDGIQTNHPDLALNYDPHASTDINDNDDDPMPRDNGDNKHGTRCAGEVAAVAFNNYCGVGVAYNASIGGVRMLDGTVNDAVEARALGLNPDHVDVYSASWGPEDDGKTVDGPGPLARRAFIYGVTSGRKGKGSIFVWASGNGGRHTDSCNCDGYTNSIFTLSISSATQGGYKPWYLEECSSTLATTYSSGTPGHDKSVATVDMDGKLRPDHICTVEHTGTSASAPLAAGIAALALEANPDLTWRDMQYLVVLSSRSGPLEKESGWIINGVKRKVSHKFGYGLMDAAAMVSLAEQWTNVPPQHICKSHEINEERPIDPVPGSTLQVQMDVDGCSKTLNEVRFLEHVQCKVSLRFFPRGNLRILLTSPMGTTSTLLFERPRDVVSSNFDDWPFLSVHFWGEKADGRWTLEIINGGNRRVNQPGILKKWQLIFYGTATNPIRLRPSLPLGSASGIPVSQVAASQNSYIFPDSQPTGSPAEDYFNGFNPGFQNFPNIYSVSGSNPEASVAPLEGDEIPDNAVQTYYKDSSSIAGSLKVLHTCDPECDSQGCYGKGPTQCIACKHYKLDNTCVSRCPPRSFPSQGGICWPCHESCETCAGAGQDSCLTCAPAHLRVTDLAICLQQCPEGYYENAEQNTCVPCEPNCGSCQDRPDHCTSCDHHLVLYRNKCYAACPVYTYEMEDYTCAPCHASCETCNGSSETQCLTCRTSRFELAGTCLASCPDGYYADKKRRECVRCASGCASCSGNVCLACKDGWTLNRKGRCVPEGNIHCTRSEYFTSGLCARCHENCDTCSGPGPDRCLSCISPLLLQGASCVAQCEEGRYPERGVCMPCLHTCTACESRANCTSCRTGLHLQSGECRAACADGYYSDRGICAKCYLSCMTCSGPRRDQCVTCPSGWQLAAGECHPDCPEGFFKSNFGCEKCHHYCRTCKGEGPLQCTSCPAHAMLDGGLCVQCVGTQFYDPPTQTCRGCHESCKSCSGPGAFSCSACTSPLHLDRLNNQCVPCCAKPGQQNCCTCDNSTGDCQNASPAGKRRTAASHAEPVDVSSVQEGTSMHLPTPFTTVTILAVLGCISVVVLFAIIFTVLQIKSQTWNGLNRCSSGYEKLSKRKCKVGVNKVSVVPEDGDFTEDDDEEVQLFTKT